MYTSFFDENVITQNKQDEKQQRKMRYKKKHLSTLIKIKCVTNVCHTRVHIYLQKYVRKLQMQKKVLKN